MRECTECLLGPCGSIGIAHCDEQHREYEAEQEARREEEKPQQCDSCEDADAAYLLKVYPADPDGRLVTGKPLDTMFLCTDCARDENWHIGEDGKLEC